MRMDGLIFVYNARSGVFNTLIDYFHKMISPSTYECSLCQITYDLKMKKAWKDFVEKTPHKFYFLHSEELSDHGLEKYENQLPICLEKNSKEFQIIIDKEKMDTFKNEFDLINNLNKLL